MKNWLIILLAAAVVAAGAFLPGLLLKASPAPELDMDYPDLSVSSQSSSDYAWRLDTMAEFYFGEGENLRNTYISQTSAEEGGQDFAMMMQQLESLTETGTVPDGVRQLLADCQDYRIRYYYMFDSQTVSGFRYAELMAAGMNWRVFLVMDVESGKLIRVDYGGSKLFPGGDVLPQGSWYEVLRSFGQYLGLSDQATLTGAVEAQSEGARKYYDSNTADVRRAPVINGYGSWVELRVLRENYTVTVTVYRGGK